MINQNNIYELLKEAKIYKDIIFFDRRLNDHELAQVKEYVKLLISEFSPIKR
jgi:hypothetical protein